MAHVLGLDLGLSLLGPGKRCRQSSSLQRLCQHSRQRHGHLRGGCSNGARCTAFFKFKNPLQETSENAYVANGGRDDYKSDDVEAYFNYMGMLASEGNYDRLEKLLNSGVEPIDLLLLLAASEEDAPKVAEVLRAGADLDAKDLEGRTARDIAKSQAVTELLEDRQKAYTF